MLKKIELACTGPESDRRGDTAGGVAGEHELFVEEV